MSGIEAAGIVLAVLPIAVTAAKTCLEGVEESKKVFRTADHDEIKRELFDDLWQELYLFDRHMRQTLQALPNISGQKRAQILEDTFEQQHWRPQSETVQALKLLLGNDFEGFEHTVTQICDWLQRIWADKHLSSQLTSKDSAKFLIDLRTFNEASATKHTESRFKDRLNIWRKEGKLKGEIRRLRKWREFLDKITENIQCRDTANHAAQVQKTVPRPSCMIPQMSKELHRVLVGSMRCVSNCSGTHRAKICLRNEAGPHRKMDDNSLKYNLLFSSPAVPAPGKKQWLETTIDVHVSPRKTQVGFSPSEAQSKRVQSICSAISNHAQNRGIKLSFKVEHFEHESTSDIYHKRDYYKSYFDFETTDREIKLDQILVDIGQRFDLAQRRRLALELSYGMMTLSGSPWLKERWTKEHVSFFPTTDNTVCHTQPFVSSEIEHHESQHQQLPFNIIHPLPPVLSLGILLLELERGQTIESMRTKADFADPADPKADENTDYFTAIREAETRPMLSPQYGEAISACLNEHYWDDGQDEEPSMLQEHTRKKIYEQVIWKLESDLEALTSN